LFLQLLDARDMKCGFLKIQEQLTKEFGANDRIGQMILEDAGERTV
jgi:hypothetical protein